MTNDNQPGYEPTSATSRSGSTLAGQPLARGPSATAPSCYEGTGGPGNPVMADQRDAARELSRRPLRGARQPGRVVACVSGTTHEPKRAQVEDLLAAAFPRRQRPGAARLPRACSLLRRRAPTSASWLAPARWSAAATQQAVTAVTGGRGWILGDHGSAARLGRAVLEYFVADPGRAPESLRRGRRPVSSAAATGGRSCAPSMTRPEPGAAAGPCRAAADERRRGPGIAGRSICSTMRCRRWQPARPGTSSSTCPDEPRYARPQRRRLDERGRAVVVHPSARQRRQLPGSSRRVSEPIPSTAPSAWPWKARGRGRRGARTAPGNLIVGPLACPDVTVGGYDQFPAPHRARAARLDLAGDGRRPGCWRDLRDAASERPVVRPFR